MSKESTRANQRRSILVVDDDVLIRSMLSEFLRDEGYAVEEAESADEAKTLLAPPGVEYSLLISDVVMPGEMDGIQLAHWTRQNRPEIAVLLMSGYTGTTRGVAYPFIAKPCRFARLVEMAEQLIREKRVNA